MGWEKKNWWKFKVLTSIYNETILNLMVICETLGMEQIVKVHLMKMPFQLRFASM